MTATIRQFAKKLPDTPDAPQEMPNRAKLRVDPARESQGSDNTHPELPKRMFARDRKAVERNIENTVGTEYHAYVVSRDEKTKPPSPKPGTLRVQFHVPAGGVRNPVVEREASELRARGIPVEIVEHAEEPHKPKSNRSRANKANVEARIAQGKTFKLETEELEVLAAKVGNMTVMQVLEQASPELASAVRARETLRSRTRRHPT